LEGSLSYPDLASEQLCEDLLQGTSVPQPAVCLGIHEERALSVINNPCHCNVALVSGQLEGSCNRASLTDVEHAGKVIGGLLKSRNPASVFAHHTFRLAGFPDPDVEVAAANLHR
jgi:hypothetical protein